MRTRNFTPSGHKIFIVNCRAIKAPASLYTLAIPGRTVRLAAHPVHLIAHPPAPVDNGRDPKRELANMKSWWRICLAGTMLLAPAPTGLSQNASYWRSYKVYDGLHQSVCVAVSVAPNGKVLATHPDHTFATELDGYHVTPVALPEPVEVISESPGGQLWASVQNGLLQQVKPDTWVTYPVPKAAGGISSFMPLHPVRHGHVLFLRDDQLMELNTEDPKQPQVQVLLKAGQTRLGKLTDLVAARDGGVWIAGERGLGKVSKLKNDWSDYLPPESLQIQSLMDIYTVHKNLVFLYIWFLRCHILQLRFFHIH